jgi:hypothetical protein
MPTFAVRPDPRYYQAIVQHDDGSFTADQKPLDDRTTSGFDHKTATMQTIIIPGLKTVVKNSMVNVAASNYIYYYAPDWTQRNANNILANPSGYTPQEVQDAKDMWTWINACIAYSNSISAGVDAMTFEQIIVYIVPVTGWPVPPASLIPPAPTV